MSEKFMNRKLELKERMKKLLPDKDTVKWINKIVEETDRVNEGRLDKQSFRLGLYSMYQHLVIVKKITNE